MGPPQSMKPPKRERFSSIGFGREVTMSIRTSGILLHISSLPSPYGIGDLGPGAHRFADFLSSASQSLWQVLPLNPTSLDGGNSPYSSHSAFAGNPLLVSPDLLVEEGLLGADDTALLQGVGEVGRVAYETVAEFKRRLLREAHRRFSRLGLLGREFRAFCDRHRRWLDDYSLYVALKEKFQGSPWYEWPRDLRDRRRESLERLTEELDGAIEVEKFSQYLFFCQWHRLKRYCNSKNIKLIGDIPIYVSWDSADVWANPSIFQLDDNGLPISVAGVPPDYFSSHGQLWGNPLYRWDELKRLGYGWWIERFEQNLLCFDAVRLDHFRGFVGYWAVPYGETTAVHGKWEKGPGGAFFEALMRRFPYLPIIAEDLGVITPRVRETIRRFGFPGMRVLQFAFDRDVASNPHAPHNHENHCVVYTGTHDNNTTRGWFENDLAEEDRARVSAYLGRRVTDTDVHWALVRAAMMSVADTAMIPLQDVLGLGSEGRMNQPAVPRGNWEWRVHPEALTEDLAAKLSEMTFLYGRA